MSQRQEGRKRMPKHTRRSLFRNALGLVASGTLARSYIANAAAKTATVWWVQGFAEEEDVAFKTSDNTIDYTLMPFAPTAKDRLGLDQRGCPS
jgi:hypothetical protein